MAGASLTSLFHEHREPFKDAQPPKPDDKDKPPDPAGGGGGRLGLPTTLLAGGVKPGDSCPAGQKMDEAVAKQQDLLAEPQYFFHVRMPLPRDFASIACARR